jgi:hypothetical protein
MILEFSATEAAGKLSIPITAWTDQVINRVAYLQQLPRIEATIKLIKQQFRAEIPKLLPLLKNHPAITSLQEPADRFVGMLELAYAAMLRERRATHQPAED